jgi:hypothetical protein
MSCCSACAQGHACSGSRDNPRKRRHNPDKKPSAASKVPKSQIDFIVGNIHVGTPDEEVADNIRRRCEKNGFPAAVMKACVVYALKAHKRNRDLYNDVMMGRTSRRRSSR